MTEQEMREECGNIQREWQMEGLTGGAYEDFAVELAKRVLQRLAKDLEGNYGWRNGTREYIDDIGDFIRDMG